MGDQRVLASQSCLFVIMWEKRQHVVKTTLNEGLTTQFFLENPELRRGAIQAKQTDEGIWLLVKGKDLQGKEIP